LWGLVEIDGRIGRIFGGQAHGRRSRDQQHQQNAGGKRQVRTKKLHEVDPSMGLEDLVLERHVRIKKSQKSPASVF
jgi:hypothetical protein